MSEATGRHKIRVGRVVSDKMDKTVVVAVERRVHHPLYHKSVRHLAKFKAHDEQNAYRVGDLVRIIETRPMSATKRWRVTDLLERKELADAISGDGETQQAQPAQAEAKPAATATASRTRTAAKPAEPKAEAPKAEEPVAEAKAEETAEPEEPATVQESSDDADAAEEEAEERPSAEADEERRS
jgi:small subunit ribosomal protein S17